MHLKYYNQEQKERYIISRELENLDIRKICDIFFKITKKYEAQLQKDCSDFLPNEIFDMYNSYATTSCEQLLIFNSQLKSYTDWCIKEKLVSDNQNHYEELDKDSLYTCVKIEFYNQEQKERYISTRESEYLNIRKICRVFFKATRAHEEKLQKDCSTFTTKEILNMYNSYATRSWEQLLNFNSQLKIYTRWCLKESLVPDNQNHYEELDKEDMYKCLNLGLKESMIITRKELEKEIIKFPNPSEKFMALAFFEGLGGLGYKDFFNLLPQQFANGKVKLSDRELTVSNLLINSAYESAAEYSKYSQDGRKKSGYLKNDPYVIKESSNSAGNVDSEKLIRLIQRRIRVMGNQYGKAYGYVGLKTSGRIDMIKRFMKEDKSDDVRQTYEKHKDEIEYRYGKLQRIHRWLEENSQFFS